MLSATPVNNNLKDLRNQINFITEGHNDAFSGTFGVANIQETLRVAQKTFNDWVKDNPDRDTNLLLDKLSTEFFKLLDELTIARSRRHIQKFYADTVAALGGFPERAKPESLYPSIDLKGRFKSYDQLNEDIEKYQLSLFGSVPVTGHG